MNRIVLPPPVSTDPESGDWVTLPESIGKGGIRILDLVSGARLAIADYQFNQPTAMQYNNPEASLGFGFCLSGQIETHESIFRDRSVIKGGQCAFFAVPKTTGYTETVGTERMLRISILIKQELMTALMAYRPSAPRLPSFHNTPTPFRSVGQTSPAMRMAIDQMLHCPFHGVARMFFLESKIMELAAYKMAQFEKGKPRLSTKPMLSTDDIDRIRYAAQLLTRDFENAPSLADLSRRIGMCRTKLHRCFQIVHGVTPFDYLRNRRLEAARLLLCEGRMNVTEAAFSVGYSSLSHFSKTFNQYFGFPPGKARHQPLSVKNRRSR